jgi:hypothetical protein
MLADQFFLGILTDSAKLVVDVSDRALDIGHGHDGMLIQCELLIAQFLERGLAGGKAFLHDIFGSLPFGDVTRDLGETLVNAVVVVHGSDHDVGPENGAVLADSLRLLFEASLGKRLLQFVIGFVIFASLQSVKTGKMLA